MASIRQIIGSESFTVLLGDTILGGESKAAYTFDRILIVVILASVGAVMLESIEDVNARYHNLLYVAEWMFTVVFTIEYIARLICSPKPLLYARSFYGIVDLLSVVPTYISVFVPGAQALIVIRLLRIVRVFRVFKLVKFTAASSKIWAALIMARPKITVFLVTVLALVTVLGSLMYLVEGAEHGFDSIPRSIYWAIVTLTTVGYGDISPGTPIGQFIAAIVMIIGYGIIAVPTGIVTAEMTYLETRSNDETDSDRAPVTCTCGDCLHGPNAYYCKTCGRQLSLGGSTTSDAGDRKL